MFLDIFMAIAATFLFSVIQKIISLLYEMEVSFLCLPGHLLSKPAPDQSAGKVSAFEFHWPFSGLPLPFALSGKVLLQLDLSIAA